MTKSLQLIILLTLGIVSSNAQNLDVKLNQINTSGWPFVWTLSMDADSNLYAGDELGELNVKKNGESTWTQNKSFNVGNDDIRGINVLDKNDIWVCTDGKGIHHFDGTSWQQYTSSNAALPSDEKWRKCIKDTKGTLWFSNRDFGLAQLIGTTWSFINTTNSKLKFNTIHDLILDTKGTVWVASYGQILSFKNNVWTEYNLNEIYNSSQLNVNSLYEDKKGTIWVCTLKGLYAFENNTWVDKTTISGKKEVQVMTIDKNETIWYQEYGVGLVRYKNGTKQTFEGSTSNKIPTQAWVMLVNSKNEKLLVGNKGANLIIVNDDALSTSTKENIENENIIYPNPTSDYFYIAGDTNFQYEIYDLDGKKLLNGLSSKNKIDVTSLPIGRYTVKLQNGKIESTTPLIKI